MKNLKTGDDVIYTGETNSWTYHKDIEQNSQGWVESVILSNNEISYRVNFDNGVTAIIDFCDLIENNGETDHPKPELIDHQLY